MSKISDKIDLVDVDGAAMKARLAADAFDKGRSPTQLATSFASCIAYHLLLFVG